MSKFSKDQVVYAPMYLPISSYIFLYLPIKKRIAVIAIFFADNNPLSYISAETLYQGSGLLQCPPLIKPQPDLSR